MKKTYLRRMYTLMIAGLLCGASLHGETTGGAVLARATEAGITMTSPAGTAILQQNSTGAAVVSEEPKGLPNRAEIKDEYKWKLEEIYPNKQKWESDFNLVKNQYLDQIKEFKGKLSKIESILECFKLSDKVSRKMTNVYVYAALKSDINKADAESTEMKAKAEALYAQVGESASFIEPELLSLKDKKFEELLKSKKLKSYHHYLDRLSKRKEHTLSKEEEELLAKVGDFAGVPREIFDKLSLADMKLPVIKDESGKDVQLTNGNYNLFIRSSNRDVRRNAFEAMYKSYEKTQHTFAASVNGEVRKNIFYAKARKYKSALEGSIMSDNIPVDVYKNLVKAVGDNVGSLHKYVALRKKVLKVDKVHLYDMYVNLVDNYEMKIGYEDSKKMMFDALAPMGDEYINTLKEAFNKNWIDVYETENKYNGAYNWGSYETHPYVLMNYNDSLEAVLTTAHEMGHAMHSYYTNKTQEYVNSSTPIFTAEVASTTNELILLEYLIKNAKNKEEKLYLLNNLVENIRGTVFTQVMYAEFEKLIHDRVEEGEAISSESLRKIWKDLMIKYFGNDFEADPLSDMWWSRIPHFYMNFYVYKYATGISAAYPLSQGLIKGEKDAKKRYLDFLKAGDSDYPIEILKRAGVDMASTKPVDELLKLFDKLVGEMEIILKEEGKI